jgi:beta-glucanase (GH16 family)
MKTIIKIELYLIIFNNLSLIAQISPNHCDYQIVITPTVTNCNENPFVLVFSDDFNANNLDESKFKLPFQGVTNDFDNTQSKNWFANTGNTPSLPVSNNIEVSNGTIKLMAKKEDIPIEGTIVVDWSTTPPTTKTDYYSYSSGWIESKYKFSYGYYEIRCKIPKGKGFWPAFWLYGSNPRWNEIDVFEFWNQKVLGNYDPIKSCKTHVMTSWYGFDGNNQAPDKCGTQYQGPDFSEDFHTFGVLWTPNRLEWFVDSESKRINTFYITMQGQTIDCNANLAWAYYQMSKFFPRNQPMQIIANLAIQSSINAPNNETPFPSSLEIDYIRYYKQMPCNGNLFFNDLASLNLDPEIFNVIVGTNVNISNNVILPDDQQLTIIASNEIIIDDEFYTNSNSDFIAQIDNSICGSSGRYSSNNTLTNNMIKDSKVNFKSDSLLIPLPSNDIIAYPNPTIGRFSVNLNFDPINKFDICINDITGNEILRKRIINQKDLDLDISQFSKGLYFLNIKYDNQFLKTIKIIKSE